MNSEIISRPSRVLRHEYSPYSCTGRRPSGTTHSVASKVWFRKDIVGAVASARTRVKDNTRTYQLKVIKVRHKLLSYSLIKQRRSLSSHPFCFALACSSTATVFFRPGSSHNNNKRTCCVLRSLLQWASASPSRARSQDSPASMGHPPPCQARSPVS